MARLFLHGGAPKTGTSAIQVLLARHAEALAARGVVYPEGHLFEAARRGQVTAGNGLAMANYLNPDLPHAIADKDAFSETFAQHLEAAAGRDLAYSSEALRFADTERARRLVDMAAARGYAPRYIYLVRTLSDFAVSAYSQHVKRHGETRPFAAYLEEWRPPYQPAIAQATKLFGAEAVEVLNYDTHKGRLAELFFKDLFGVDFVPQDEVRVNRSLGAQELAVMRAVNRAADGRARVAAFVSDAIIAGDAGDAPLRLGPEDAAAMERFAKVVTFVNQRIRGEPIALVGKVAPAEADYRLTPVEAALVATMTKLAMRVVKP